MINKKIRFIQNTSMILYLNLSNQVECVLHEGAPSMYIKNSCSPSELIYRYATLLLSLKDFSEVITHRFWVSEEKCQRYIPFPSSVFSALLNLIVAPFLECSKDISKTYFISWSIIDSLNHVIASI